MSNKKGQGQSFLKGAAILSASTIIVKFISFFFTIPLTNIIGSEGMAPYNATYTIFAVFNAIATAGLPVAVSKMVSSAHSLGQDRQAEKIFSVAFRTFSIVGLVLSIIMFFFSSPLSLLMNRPEADLSVKALAPTVFFASVMSAIRGFFQGKSNMKPTAVSQLLEALVKVLVGLSLASYIYMVFKNSDAAPAMASAGAIAGVSVSAFFGAFYLFVKKKKDRRESLSSLAETSRKVQSNKTILKNLIRIAVPITIGSCFLFVLDAADSSIINARLASYLPEKEAAQLYGSWGPAMRIFDLPGAIIIPVATSLIPLISAALTQQDYRRVSRSATSAIRITLLITVPCAVGFFLFGVPIAKTIYFSKQATSDVIGMLLTTISAGVVFNGLLYTTNSLMQAMGNVKQPVINMAIGGIVRILLNYYLIGIPVINIRGSAISSTISYLVTLILNLISVYKLVPQTENILLSFIPTALASALMGLASYFSYQWLCLLINPKIALFAAICIAVIVYIPAAILLRAIRKSELEMLPKGKKIAEIFHLYEGAHFG